MGYNQWQIKALKFWAVIDDNVDTWVIIGVFFEKREKIPDNNRDFLTPV